MLQHDQWPHLEPENQAELLAYLGTATCAESVSTATITWVITGVDSNDYNGVVWTRLSPAEADQLVPKLVEMFHSSHVPALWHLDPASQPADLAQRLDHLGCRPLSSGVCMVAALDSLPQTIQLAEGLRVQRVTTERDLDTWLDVWMHNDDEPRQPREQLYRSLGLSATQPLRHYLARLDGEPVGVSQLFLGRRAAGLYCVSVLPAFRRRGIGTALTLTPFHDAQREGYIHGVLGPSPEGQPLYAQLGFTLFPSPFVGYTLWHDQ
jgi:ribosomal protein S18 acetylase RimI-like enzyme